MPHANNWMSVTDPRTCTPPSYDVEADPIPEIEDINVLTEKLRRIEYANATLVYQNDQLQQEVDQLRREKDRWKILWSVKRGQ
jgi:hypothetical protein